MKMYVANCTRQVQEFQFKRVEVNSSVRLTIPVGQQVLIPIDLSAPEIDAIVAQHARYGFIASNARVNGVQYNSLCYSLDKPVTVDGIQLAIQRNMDYLEVRGQQIREEAAVAINDTIETKTAQANLEPPKSTTVSIEEKATLLNPDPQFDQTLVVDRSAAAPVSKRK